MIQPLLEGEFLEMAKEQEQAEADILARPNVVGVALGKKVKDGRETEEKAIQVLVNQKLPRELLRSEALVPPTIGKYKVDVIDVGEIFAQNLLEPVASAEYGTAFKSNGMTESLVPQMAALAVTPTVPPPRVPVAPQISYMPQVSYVPTPQILTQRVRPVFGGFSVGHFKITAGTVATCCYDLMPFPGIPSKYFILSNNHVLANSNNANLGDPILQPGPADGGTLPADLIGRLARFIPIRFHTPTTKPLNFVDAAIAEVQFHEVSREIYWIGYLNRRLPPTLPVLKIGAVLQKTGRTTNFSTGKVISLNATVDVNYGGGNVARFANQIVTTAMSAPGDSGSLVTDLEERAVALLFAGSGTVTICNPISLVQSLLKIRLTELPV